MNTPRQSPEVGSDEWGDDEWGDVLHIEERVVWLRIALQRDTPYPGGFKSRAECEANLRDLESDLEAATG